MTRIQNYLHIGRIRANKNKPYSIYIASIEESIIYILKNINGQIRLKVSSYKEACTLYNIKFIEAQLWYSFIWSHFAGLVDTSGSIVFNYAGIE